jgi:hypothetical protein
MDPELRDPGEVLELLEPTLPRVEVDEQRDRQAERRKREHDRDAARAEDPPTAEEGGGEPARCR